MPDHTLTETPDATPAWSGGQIAALLAAAAISAVAAVLTADSLFPALVRWQLGAGA